jgi:hypothetical protein
MKIVRRSVAFLSALLFLVLTTSASAAPTPKERAQAKSAWMKGKRLVTQEKKDEAVESLRIAVELDPKAQYQLDLARALVEIKALVEARELCDAIAETKEPNTQKAKQVAASLKKDLEPRIPTITVILTGDAANATATINGESVGLGKPLPFDPGVYTVRARVRDNPEVSERVELREREKKTVTLDPTSTEAPKPPTEEASSGGNMLPAAIAYGVGGAALIAGGVTGFLAFQKTDEVQELCGGNDCPPEFAGDVATAQDLGTASTVLFAVGGLGVAAGLILTFTVGLGGDAADEKKDEKKSEAWVRPIIGPGQLGLYGAF